MRFAPGSRFLPVSRSFGAAERRKTPLITILSKARTPRVLAELLQARDQVRSNLSNWR
jgi:hypothetical protein